jgi:hypothetical protein
MGKFLKVEINSLPFTFDCPENCQIRQIGPQIVVVNRRDPKFAMNIVCGRYSGSHSVPPGYVLKQRRQFPTPRGDTQLLIAHSPRLMLAHLAVYLMFSILLGIILGSILFYLLRQFVPLGEVRAWIAIATLVVMVYIVATTKSKIKYAFVYDGVEYVFTGLSAQQNEIDKCINSIRFK